MSKKDENKKDANENPRHFEPIETNFFRFSEVGQEVEGEIINIDTETSQDVILYSVKDDEGTVRKFHDSTMLKDLLAQVKLGDYIKVVYVGDEPMSEGKTLKVFKVSRSE
jgi:hypothetical protein